jgi:hypothetical protein
MFSFRKKKFDLYTSSWVQHWCTLALCCTNSSLALDPRNKISNVCSNPSQLLTMYFALYACSGYFTERSNPTERTVPCLWYLTTSDHQRYSVRPLRDAKLYLSRLLMTPFNLLHWFISDSTSRHYNLSLQWVLTLWCLVSERFLDLFCLECWQLTDWLLATDSWSKSKSHCDWRSVSQSVSLGVKPHLGLMIRYLLQFDSFSLGFVECPLWREDGSVFCICCRPLPAQSFSGPSPLGVATIFYCLRFETSLFVASYDS